jgi:hypothetical protein
VSWLTRLLGRDHEQDRRIAEAAAQREDAAAELAEAREVAARNRGHLRRNHITEGIAAAFERRERHA